LAQEKHFGKYIETYFETYYETNLKHILNVFCEKNENVLQNILTNISSLKNIRNGF